MITGIYFDAACETQVLLREETLIVAHRHHPAHCGELKSLEELAEFRWVMTGDETLGPQLMRRIFGRTGVQLPLSVVKMSSIHATIDFLRHSRTLGTLSQTHTRPIPRLLRSIHLAGCRNAGAA